MSAAGGAPALHGGQAAPVAALQAVFSDIAATRMRDLAILNPALRVETVAFREWEGRWLGVLVTPWTINLMLLGGHDAPLAALQSGELQHWSFPSGSYAFMGVTDERLGSCQACSLISPVEGIASQEQARAVAMEVMEALFTTPPAAAVAAERGSAPVAQSASGVAAGHGGTSRPAGAETGRTGRRAFLRAVLPGA